MVEIGNYSSILIWSQCLNAHQEREPSLKALPYDTSWFERANAGELGGLCYDKEERKLTPLLFVPTSPRG